MSNDAALCSLSNYLLEKICKPHGRFFDTDLICKLNDTLRSQSICCAMTIFDESVQDFKSLLWCNLEETDPPFREYMKSDSFQQYIKETLKNTAQADKPFQVFVGHDFYPGNNYDDEPYIKLLKNYYPNLAIKYCVKVPLGKNRNYWLNLFKKESDGDFQKNDLDLINCICELIVNAYNTYEYRLANKEKLDAINNAFEYFGAGLITFDKDYESLSFMGLSNDILHSITGCVRKKDALDALHKLIYSNGISKNNILCASLHDYNCYLDEPESQNDRGYVLFFPHPRTPGNKLAEFESLTTREREVAMCLASGYSYKDISEELFISISTVRNHVTNIYRKLNINNQRQLISMYFGKTENKS